MHMLLEKGAGLLLLDIFLKEMCIIKRLWYALWIAVYRSFVSIWRWRQTVAEKLLIGTEENKLNLWLQDTYQLLIELDGVRNLNNIGYEGGIMALFAVIQC